MSNDASSQAPSRMGRPAAFVREEAVKAAMNLFWMKGFLASSATDLADAMGIQRSSFYNSFGSREALFEEALAHYATQTPDAPLYRVQPGQAVVPVIASVMREICRIRAQDRDARGCMMCNAIAELVGVENSLGALIERGVRNMKSAVERLLRQAAEQGEIAALENPVASADSFVAFLIGLNTISKVIRNEKELWAMCVQFLRGLGLTEKVLRPSRRPPSLQKKRKGRAWNKPGRGSSAE